jgi:hypothetical protein
MKLQITSEVPAEFDLTLETGARFAALAVKELQSETCYCGAKKRGMQTFCRKDYYALPPKMRQALYNRIGEGYEEAYQEARKYLFEKSQGK